MSVKRLQLSTKGSGVKSQTATKGEVDRARLASDTFKLRRILLAAVEDRVVNGVTYRGIYALSMKALNHEIRIAAMQKDPQLVGKVTPARYRELIVGLIEAGELEIKDVSTHPHVTQFNARRIVAPEADQPQPRNKTKTCRRGHGSSH